ncbi:MAG: hypothetical protein KatS3mg003_1062 [Candidatus Nitrosocaldaceae archaeon]|nr:MAG: hypothetical protein KatS3mg003_1062 [Candidatus Nitrosocaldaceae archaeon]
MTRVNTFNTYFNLIKNNLNSDTYPNLKKIKHILKGYVEDSQNSIVMFIDNENYDKDNSYIDKEKYELNIALIITYKSSKIEDIEVMYAIIDDLEALLNTNQDFANKGIMSVDYDYDTNNKTHIARINLRVMKE